MMKQLWPPWAKQCSNGWAMIRGNHPIGRIASPEEIASLFVYLASDWASFFTGSIIMFDGGYTAKSANACVIVPTVNMQTVTPHAEAFQGVVWHLLVSHPAVKLAETKWESARAA